MRTIKIEFTLTEREQQLLASVHCDMPSGEKVKGMLLMEAARLARREIDNILYAHFESRRKTVDVYGNPMPTDGGPAEPGYAMAIENGRVTSVRPYKSGFTKDLMKGPFGLGKKKPKVNRVARIKIVPPLDDPTAA